MRCVFFRWLPLAVAMVAVASTALGQAPDVDPEEVREAIKNGTNYLLKNQRPDGSWGEYPLQPTGKTALVALALLNSGVPPTDPDLKQALDWLEKQAAPRATYAASLQIMALAMANPVQYRPRITSLAMWLEERQFKDGEERGGWTYYDRPGPVDNSNSQFAVLALHEAERVGVKIKEQTWKLALDYWIDERRQHPDGSWSYGLDNPAVSGSMTCAGIASVIIARDRLRAGDASVRGTSIQCCGLPADSGEDSVQRGLAWMAKKFTVSQNPNTAGIGGISRSYPWLLYYLYGVERVGRMSGQRFIGTHDWYREGCRFLIDQRDLNGSWQGTGPGEADPIVGTSLALLFLSKGRRPVVVARLMHDESGDWNLHRRSIQNLVGRVERQWKRDLAWQSFDLKHSSVVDLLEAPVLFLSGSQSLRLSKDDEAKLKEYVNQGGFIFAEACEGDGCNGKQFDQDFRALVGRLFPESKLRRLPPDHAVWFAQERVNPKDLPKDEEFWLWGLDACCRTAIVYCPRSLSCRWELGHPYHELPYPDEVKREVEACVRIGGNVLAYATNRELKDKLEKPQVSVLVNKERVPRGALVLRKLNHGGGADDAPNALGNLLAVFDKQLSMKVDYDRRPPIGANDPAIFQHPILFAHGRRSFTFSAGERKALKDYFDRGGFLFADAICASKPFADSLREELKAIYPEAQFTRIPPSHPLFTDEFHGFRIGEVTLRDPSLRDESDPLIAKPVKISPLLEGLEIDGRIAVILSPYDISCALEKGTSLECKGYIPQDAARIGANVILYALQQ
ncbi:MAG TPA: DUF4159 domain-containing protein [Pirellulaceae bacterium]|nr:DUF4159 domain-containing protein [Pirellulaceae bacterium]